MKNNLEKLRKFSGLSLQDLADMYGGTKSHCWTLEQGKSSPTLKTAYAISNILNVNVYDIWPDNTEIIEETIVIRRVKQNEK